MLYTYFVSRRCEVEHEGRRSSDQRWCGVESWKGNGILSGVSSLYVKFGLSGAPTSWLAHLQTPQLPNMQQQSSSIKRLRHSLSVLPSLSPYWASPFLQPWRALCSTFQWLFRLFKTDRLPTASLPSLHTLYLASLLFFKHDGLTVFSDNLWLINEQPSSWIKVFYEKWCPASFLSLPKYVNIFQLKPGRILQEGAVLHWH